MKTQPQPPHAAREAASSIFSRVLVGVDESPESLEAARQAATLAMGDVTLLGTYDLMQAVVGAGMAPTPPVQLDERPIREQTEAALARAAREFAGTARIKVAKGRAWEMLLEEIVQGGATLVAVGSHGAGRAKGILIGSTATELVHKASCSVLVARKPLNGFPSSIVVGLDGSKESAKADAVAAELAQRFGARLERYRNVDDPVSALVEAAIETDLLVVGSRGLHGLKALGSVSERVAHQARCSVLIVR